MSCNITKYLQKEKRPKTKQKFKQFNENCLNLKWIPNGC